LTATWAGSNSSGSLLICFDVLKKLAGNIPLENTTLKVSVNRVSAAHGTQIHQARYFEVVLAPVTGDSRGDR
jgi:hypothetical protein